MKKLFIFIVLSLSMLGLTACKSEFDRETARIAQYFDLSVPQEIWDGNFPLNFGGGYTILVIRVVFKPFREDIETIPDIELHHFGVKYAGYFRLGYGSTPTEWWDSWNRDPSIIMFGTILFPWEYSNWQTDRQDRDRIFIPSIRQIESLPFVQSATPIWRHGMWVE